MTKSSVTHGGAGGSLGGKRALRALGAIFSICMALVLLCPAESWSAESRTAYQELVGSIGKGVFFLAWPTADYESVSFGDVYPTANGADISFRLHGKSGINGGPLWVDVIIEVRDGKITDLRWGRNNAVLAQPGSTIEAWGQALAQLNEQSSRSRRSDQTVQPNRPSSQSNGFGYLFTNHCKSPVEVAICYRDTSGQWRTDGWWTFAPGGSAYLFSDGSKLAATTSEWYFYAATTDGSDWKWAGEYTVSLNGRTLHMRKVIDKEGDSEWSVDCQ
jgi:hypothetical protein